MPKYHVEFDIETDNENAVLLNNALIAGIRNAGSIMAQHGMKVVGDDFNLRFDEEMTADDAQRNSEGTSAPPSSPDDASDSEPPPAP